MIFCYKRVSTIDQSTDRQLIGMKFDREFVEHVSAKDTERSQLKKLLAILREGDQVHVHDLSRLARNTKDLLELVNNINNEGASIQFHKEQLTFKSGEKKLPVQELMLSLLGAIAQFERDLLLERQREGISLAKQRGVYKGRPSKFSKEDIIKMKSEFVVSKNKSKLASKWKITRAYLYRLCRDT